MSRTLDSPPKSGSSHSKDHEPNAFDEEFVPSSLIGAQIDKWTLSRLLGQGGMSIVYEARHIWLEQSAAIKLLLPDICKDKKALRRFRKEAMAVSQLRHPNIIEVKDFGRDPTHGYYMVLELLEGATLQPFLADAPLPKTWLAHVARQLCEALAVTHEAGVIHRDLKPSNVFLTPSQPLPDVKLLDFGVAKVLLEEEQDQLTGTGVIVGTPGYLSPEQVSGEALQPASDIYALAILLYQSLCGVMPLRAKTLLRYAMLVLKQTPPPIGKHRPDLDGSALETLLAKMLSRKPEDRPGSAMEAWAALEEAFADFDDPLDLPAHYPQIEALGAVEDDDEDPHSFGGLISIESDQDMALVPTDLLRREAQTPSPDEAPSLLTEPPDRDSGEHILPVRRVRTQDLPSSDAQKAPAPAAKAPSRHTPQPLRTLDLPTPTPSSEKELNPPAEAESPSHAASGASAADVAGVPEVEPAPNVAEAPPSIASGPASSAGLFGQATSAGPDQSPKGRSMLWLFVVVFGLGLAGGWMWWSSRMKAPSEQPVALRRGSQPTKTPGAKSLTAGATPDARAARRVPRQPQPRRRLSLDQLQQQYKSLKQLQQVRAAWKQTQSAMARGDLALAQRRYRAFGEALKGLQAHQDGALARAFLQARQGDHRVYKALDEAQRLRKATLRHHHAARFAQARKSQEALLALLKGSPAHGPLQQKMALEQKRRQRVAQALRLGHKAYQRRQWRRARKAYLQVLKVFPKASWLKRRDKACRCAVRLYPWEICASSAFPKHHPKYRAKRKKR